MIRMEASGPTRLSESHVLMLEAERRPVLIQRYAAVVSEHRQVQVILSNLSATISIGELRGLPALDRMV
jgi:hypothetical protein